MKNESSETAKYAAKEYFTPVFAMHTPMQNDESAKKSKFRSAQCTQDT